MPLEGREDEKTSGSTVGHLPTLMYYPNFLTEAEEKQLLDSIYQAPVSKWKKLMNRRLQNWGGVVHEKGLISQDLPPWLTTITQRIYEDSGILPAVPNHVLINEYLPDQGIMPHQDGPAYFPAAAILSLGSPVVMDFAPHSKLEPSENESEHNTCTDKEVDSSKSSHIFSLLLMPRSLLIFKDLAYSDYLHGIKDSELQQYGACVNLTEDMKSQIREQQWGSSDGEALCRTTTRVSLTCRLVLKVRKNLIKI